MNSIADKLEKLEKREYGKEWDYKITGNKLIGTVTRIAIGIPSKGVSAKADLLEVVDNTGKLWTVWLRSLLKKELLRLGIREGDKIGIKALGKPDGKRYYDFIVVKETSELP